MTYVTHAPPLAGHVDCSGVLQARPEGVLTFQGRKALQRQGLEPLPASEIVHGIALVMRHSRKWGEAVVDILGPGSLILGDGSMPADCSIVAATTVHLMPLCKLGTVGAARRMSAELARQRHRRLILAQATALERVAFFLVQLAAPPCQRNVACDGCALMGGRLTIPVSRREMGSLLSLTVETLSRCLARLRQDRVIDVVTANLITVLAPAALIALGGDGGASCRSCAAPDISDARRGELN